MIDLSANKHVKRMCMMLCGDRAHHSINLSRIDNEIRRRFIDNNIPVDWNVVRTNCNEVVRIYIEEYIRVKKLPQSTFRIREKIGMANNIMDYFKNKYGAVPDKHDAYVMDLLDRIEGGRQ